MKKLLSLSIIAVIVATFSILTYSCSAETDEIENKVIITDEQTKVKIPTGNPNTQQYEGSSLQRIIQSAS